MNVTAEAYVEWETVFGSGGALVFDYYSPGDYKYVTLDTTGGTVTIGHRIRNKFVVDLTVAATMAAGADQKLLLALSGTTVTVSLNGTQLTTYSFYGNVVDGCAGPAREERHGLVRQHAPAGRDARHQRRRSDAADADGAGRRRPLDRRRARTRRSSATARSAPPRRPTTSPSHRSSAPAFRPATSSRSARRPSPGRRRTSSATRR